MQQRNRNQFHSLLASSALVLPLLLGNAFGQIGSPAERSDRGAACFKRNGVSRGYGRPVRLVSSELMDQVIDKRPVESPGLLGKNHLRGVVRIEVLINKRGTVVCVHGVDGHPLGIVAAVRSVREWTFKPYYTRGKPKSVVGVLIIPYDFGS